MVEKAESAPSFLRSIHMIFLPQFIRHGMIMTKFWLILFEKPKRKISDIFRSKTMFDFCHKVVFLSVEIELNRPRPVKNTIGQVFPFFSHDVYSGSLLLHKSKPVIR